MTCIYCSAGVGRTGTYITIQSMMQMIEEEDRLDVFNFVLGMRHERNLMVQTEVTTPIDHTHHYIIINLYIGTVYIYT